MNLASFFQLHYVLPYLRVHEQEHGLQLEVIEWQDHPQPQSPRSDRLGSPLKGASLGSLALGW